MTPIARDDLIVFDLGGVLAAPEGKIEALADGWGVAAEALEAPYWDHRLPYDAGESNLDYFSRVAADLGVPMDEELANRLGRADAEHWAVIRPAAEQILADLHTAGVPTAILSNAPVDMAAAIERAGWRRLVGEVVVSGVLGVVKPEPQIYAAVEQATGRAPGHLVFIDDRQPNVDAALAAGWQAHLWHDDDSTRQVLVEGGWLG